MRFSILTLFPEAFTGAFHHSMLGRALEKELVTIQLIQIRDHALDSHHTVDDAPYGGGPGMVLKPEVMARALHAVQDRSPGHVILLTPQGQPLTQQYVQRLSTLPHVILICGHYEGVDERFTASYVQEEISIGDFILTGGEIPAMALVDAVVRLVPGVLGDPASHQQDSFGHGLLDHPHYTRPELWEKQTVPAVLRSGHHGQIAQWRHRQSLLRTLLRRPDLLANADLSRSEQRLLEKLATALCQDLIESE